MKTSRTVVGVDTAKRVFQLYWVELETGKSHGSAAESGEVPRALRQSRSVPGCAWRRAAARSTGLAVCGSWATRSRLLAGEDGEALRCRQQERFARRPRDLDGGATA